MIHSKLTAFGRMAVFTCATAFPTLIFAEIPEGYPDNYAEIIAKAEAEGSVVIYSNTEHAAVEAILADFKKAYPNIRADYIEIKAADLFSRVSSEAAADALKADIVWSSAMDLQYQMVEDGIAAEYASPEKGAIPEWASYNDRIYGTTFEPVVMVYNSKVIPDDQMPDTRQGLAEWLTENRAEMSGKVATYDPERSGLGFFAVNEDAKNGDELWPLVTAFGAVDTKFYTEQADHPNAARVFMDYLLSHRGQSVVGNEAHLFAIRPDVEGTATIAGLTAKYGDLLKPVAIGPDLLDAIQPMERLAFFREWSEALKAGK